jgi:glycosyltransferase involved in cell wall biosynthesis
MRIAFNIQPLVSGQKTGIAYSQDACIRTLIKQHPDDEFVLAYFNFKQKKAVEEYAGKNVTLMPCPRFPASAYRSLSTMLPLPYRWFFKTNADVNHFFNYIVPPAIQGRSLVTIHDMAFRRHPETVRAKTKYMLKIGLHKSIERADRIITVSEFSKKEIAYYYNYPDDKIAVVYNGVDRNRFNPALDPSTLDRVRGTYKIPKTYILYFGTLEPRKNLERLIRAYALIKQRYRDFPVLVIAGGKGWLFKSIFETVTRMGLEKDILFTGYTNDSEKICLMQGALFFCFPSLYEGFGLPVLEAMACGTPVLSSNNSSLAEIAGNAALLVDPLSEESIAGGLERLFLDESLLEELRKKGLERVRDFSWSKASSALYALYKEVSGE